MEDQDPAEKGDVKYAYQDPKGQEVGSFAPCSPSDSSEGKTKMEEEKGKFIAFDLKTRVGQPSDATKYKKYFR